MNDLDISHQRRQYLEKELLRLISQYPIPIQATNIELNENKVQIAKLLDIKEKLNDMNKEELKLLTGQDLNSEVLKYTYIMRLIKGITLTMKHM